MNYNDPWVMSELEDAARSASLGEHLPDGERNAVVIEFADFAGYYYNRMLVVAPEWDEYFGSNGYFTDVGLFQDSILLGSGGSDEADGEYPDLRFWPYEGNRLEFYLWETGGRRVFLANSASSEAAIEVDTPEGRYLLPPGASCEAKRDLPSRFRIGEPVAPAVDKHCLFEPTVADDGAVSYSAPSQPADNRDE